MKCQQFQKMISGYLDGELSAAEKSAFDSHCQGCGTCTERLREEENLRRIFAAVPKYAAPPHFAARVMADLEQGEKRASWFDFFTKEPFYWKMAEIAVAVIIMIIGALSGNIMTAGKSAQPPAEIRSSFSLDVFDAAPPNSIGGAFISITGGKHE